MQPDNQISRASGMKAHALMPEISGGHSWKMAGDSTGFTRVLEFILLASAFQISRFSIIQIMHGNNSHKIRFEHIVTVECMHPLVYVMTDEQGKPRLTKTGTKLWGIQREKKKKKKLESLPRP